MTPVLWTERIVLDEATAQQLAEAVSEAFGLQRSRIPIPPVETIDARSYGEIVIGDGFVRFDIQHTLYRPAISWLSSTRIILAHARDMLEHWSQLEHRPGLELALLYNTGLTYEPDCIERVQKAFRNGGAIQQPWDSMGGDPIGLGVGPQTIMLRGVADDGDCLVTMTNLRAEQEYLRTRVFGLMQSAK